MKISKELKEIINIFYKEKNINKVLKKNEINLEYQEKWNFLDWFSEKYPYKNNIKVCREIMRKFDVILYVFDEKQCFDIKD